MPMKLVVNVSRKIGQPDFGSLGASCGIEVELDQVLLSQDLKSLQDKMQQAYAACQDAVDQELSRQQGPRPSATTAPTSQPSPNNGNGSQGHTTTSGHRATEKQLDYARQLAGQIKGLGVRRLDAIANQMFGKPVAGLSTLDASGLIDTLKEIKAGKIDLATVLTEVGS